MTAVSRHINMVVLGKKQFLMSTIHIRSILNFTLNLIEAQGCWLESLIIGNFSPKLISTVFQWIVPQRLFIGKTIHKLCRCISDTLSKVKFVLSSSQFGVIHEWSVFIWIGPCFSFFKFILIHGLCSPVWTRRILVSSIWLTSRLSCPSRSSSCIHISLDISTISLIIASPVFCSGFQMCHFSQLNGIRRVNIVLQMLGCHVRCLIKLLSVVSLNSPSKIQSLMVSFNHMLSVVILGTCIFKKWGFVNTFSVIEVVEGIFEISLSLGIMPYLIPILKLLALLFGWVGKFAVGSKPWVSCNFRNHCDLFFSSYILFYWPWVLINQYLQHFLSLFYWLSFH